MALEALPPGDWHTAQSMILGHGTHRYATLLGDYAATMLAIAAEWSDVPARAAAVLERMITVMNEQAGRDKSLAEQRRRDANLVGNAAYYQALARWLHANQGDDTIATLVAQLRKTLTREDEVDAMKATLALLSARAARHEAALLTVHLEATETRKEHVNDGQAAWRFADLLWLLACKWREAGDASSAISTLTRRTVFFGHVFAEHGHNVLQHGDPTNYQMVDQRWGPWKSTDAKAETSTNPLGATSAARAELVLDWDESQVHRLRQAWIPFIRGTAPSMPIHSASHGAVKWQALVKFLRANPSPTAVLQRRELRKALMQAWTWNEENVKMLETAWQEDIEAERKQLATQSSASGGEGFLQRTLSFIRPTSSTTASSSLPSGPIPFDEWAELNPTPPFEHVLTRRLIPTDEASLLRWWPVPVVARKERLLAMLGRYTPREWARLGLTTRILDAWGVTDRILRQNYMKAPWASRHAIESEIKEGKSEALAETLSVGK